MHIIYDAKQEKKLDLPRSGSQFDVPLVLNSKFFTPSGNITDELDEGVSIYGDTFMVNGVIMPYMKVQGRRYKFRVLSAAASRSFLLKLTVDGKVVPLMVVGSDAGIMERVVGTDDLYVGMGERWEVIKFVYIPQWLASLIGAIRLLSTLSPISERTSLCLQTPFLPTLDMLDQKHQI